MGRSFLPIQPTELGEEPATRGCLGLRVRLRHYLGTLGLLGLLPTKVLRLGSDELAGTKHQPVLATSEYRPVLK